MRHYGPWKAWKLGNSCHAKWGDILPLSLQQHVAPKQNKALIKYTIGPVASRLAPVVHSYSGSTTSLKSWDIMGLVVWDTTLCTTEIGLFDKERTEQYESMLDSMSWFNPLLWKYLELSCMLCVEFIFQSAVAYSVCTQQLAPAAKTDKGAN